jgi:hypothetical protein
MNLLSASSRKICSVMHQLRNKKVNEKHILFTVNYFTLKSSIFKILNNFTFTWLIFLTLFYISLLTDLILVHYVLWQKAKDFLSVQ